MEELLHNPKIWVAIAFVLFLIGFIKLAVPHILRGLDSKADQIKAELDEAVHLREEAQAVLAQYQQKQREMEKEAEEILIHAKEEATAMKANAEVALKEAIDRRTKMAEEKIARAEADAVSKLQSNIADVAVNAARTVLEEQMSDSDDELIKAALIDIDRVVH